MIYGTAWKKNRTAELVLSALRNGFRAIDTANQPKHYTESLVGEALKTAAKEGIPRSSLFLQTKFTPVDGQDERIPYDPEAKLSDQVEQSFRSSLEHLGTDTIDSYILHGPYGHPGLIEEDFEVWAAMEKLYETGRAKRIGISNINFAQLEMLVAHAKIKPMVVQNRCYANRGWDLATREICLANKIEYQGFSLLTANPDVLEHPDVLAIATRLKATPAQVIFKFCEGIGIHPLTGTTDPQHMKEDLAATKLVLTDEELDRIETISC